MKKVFTTLALATAVVMTAQAQKTVDLELVSVTPSSNSTIEVVTGDTVKFVFVLKNNGTDPISQTDSVRLAIPNEIYGYTSSTGGTHITSLINWSADVPANEQRNVTFSIVEGATLNFTGGGSHVISLPKNETIDTLTFYTYGKDATGAWYIDAGVDTAGNGNIDGNNVLSITNVQFNFANSVNEITKLEKQALAVYPNPTSTDINFKYNFTSNTNASVKVTDVTGRTVLVQDFGKQTVGERNFSVNVSSLNTGMYYVELITDEVRAISKFNVAK